MTLRAARRQELPSRTKRRTSASLEESGTWIEMILSPGMRDLSTQTPEKLKWSSCQNARESSTRAGSRWRQMAISLASFTHMKAVTTRKSGLAPEKVDHFETFHHIRDSSTESMPVETTLLSLFRRAKKTGTRIPMYALFSSGQERTGQAQRSCPDHRRTTQ